MSLYRKLGLFLLCVTLVPLGAVGVVVIGIAEDALRARILEAQLEATRAEALRVAAFIEDRTEALRASAATFALGDASEEERTGAARLLFRRDDAVSAVALVDESGALLAPPAFVTADVPDAALARHPPSSRDAVARMLARAPLADALAQGVGGVVLSDAYVVDAGRAMAVQVLLPVTGARGPTMVFVVEVSLAPLVVAPANGRRTVLLDGDQRIIASADAAQLSVVDAQVNAGGSGASDSEVREGPDGRTLVSRARVPMDGLGWSVVSSLDERAAFAPVRQMRVALAAAFAVVLVALLGVSFVFVRSVRRALGAVTGGAEAFARGALDHKIEPVPRERELRELALTFNRMGDELFVARKKLTTWNDELERTVDVRTRELRDAQAKLLETRKLAAVGQLGAGVAHEINNPLATVLGTAQNFLMKKRKAGATDDDPELQAMLKVERAAKRCRDVTSTLLRFSQRSVEAKRAPVLLRSVAQDACAMTRASIEGAGHALVLEPPAGAEADVAVPADANELTQVLVHLLNNARTALLGKEHGRVIVRWGKREDGAFLEVTDDGKGIDPSIRDRIFEPFFTTKDVWQNLGLGLSESFRIVEDHGGRFEVDSKVGEGTTMRVVLPIAIEPPPTGSTA